MVGVGLRPDPHHFSLEPMESGKKTERFVAVGSFLTAVALAFTSMIISDDHDIASGVLMMCAQFLLLTATIFGLDYRILKRLGDLTHPKGG